MNEKTGAPGEKPISQTGTDIHTHKMKMWACTLIMNDTHMCTHARMHTHPHTHKISNLTKQPTNYTP